MPQSAIFPFSSTAILSAFLTEAILCAMITFVVFLHFWFKALYSNASVFKSSALVESSKISTSAFFNTARLIAILCFCPPERLIPFSATSVSYPFGCPRINSSACAIFAAFSTASSSASAFPHLIFSLIVLLNNSLFCKAIDTLSRSSLIGYSFTFLPSRRTSPSVTS